jgi:hypothetical protein
MRGDKRANQIKVVQLVSRSPVESWLDSDPTKRKLKRSTLNSEEADIFPSAHASYLVYGLRTVAIVLNVVPYIVLVDAGIEWPHRWLGI